MAQYKNKNNNTWYVKCRNPFTKKETTIRKNPKTNQPFLTKREAKEFEIVYLKGRVNTSLTFEKLFEKYLEDYLSLKPSSSADKLKSWYKCHIHKRIGRKKACNVTLTDLEHLARSMLTEGYSITYINKMTSVIKTVLNFGVSHKYISENNVLGYKPLKKIKTSEDLNYLTPREFKQLIDSIPYCFTSQANREYIRFMLMFAYLTGARKGEI